MMETLSSNNPFRGSSADQYGRLTGDADENTARRKSNNPFEVDEVGVWREWELKEGGFADMGIYRLVSRRRRSRGSGLARRSIVDIVGRRSRAVVVVVVARSIDTGLEDINQRVVVTRMSLKSCDGARRMH